MATEGFIKHEMSSKFVHPHRGGYSVPNNTNILVYDGALGEDRIKFRFYPVHGEGRYGHVQHVRSGKIVHPYGAASNGTSLVLHSDRHGGALFMYDYEKGNFVHKSGRLWHPKNGRSWPDNATDIVLHSDVHEGARFYMVDAHGSKIDPYPKPHLFGEWKLVVGVENPKVSREIKEKYYLGKSLTESTTTRQSWSVSAQISMSWFKSTAQYSEDAEKTKSETWETRVERIYTTTIEPGPTIAIWQWIFCAEQYGQKLSFESSILKDTHDVNEPPPLR